MNPYPQYRKTDKSWYSLVPVHWQNLPGLAVLKEKQIKNAGNIEKTVLSLSYGRIVIKSQDKLHGLVPESFETYQIVEPGDIVIRSTDLQNDKVSLRVGIVCNRGIITSAYMCLITKNNLNSDYAYHLLHGYDLMKVFYGMGSGLRQNLSWNDFRRLIFHIPPPDEQTQIARYLDWKTAQINKFIHAKKRLINLLYEEIKLYLYGKNNSKSQNIIKNWETSFPENWQMLKAKRIFKEVSIKNFPDSELLAVTQDRGVIPKKLCAQNYTSPAGSVSALKLVSKDDFVISLRSFQGGIEHSQYKGIVSPAYSVFSLREENLCEEYILFYKYLFKTKPFISLLNTIISGVRDGKNINYSDFAEVLLPLPLKEDVIAFQHLFNKVEYIKNNFDRIKQVLEEYKCNLTANVVTGKFDVRNIVVPEKNDVEIIDDEFVNNDDLKGLIENEELTYAND